MAVPFNLEDEKVRGIGVQHSGPGTFSVGGDLVRTNLVAIGQLY